MNTRPLNVIPLFRPKHLADLAVEEWCNFDCLLEACMREKPFNQQRANELIRIVHRLDRITKKCDEIADPTSDHEDVAMMLLALINGTREVLAHNEAILDQFDGFCALYESGHYTKKSKNRQYSTTG